MNRDEFANDETWVVVFHLPADLFDPNLPVESQWRRRAEEIIREMWRTDQDAAVARLADELKAWHEKDAPDVSGVCGHLMFGALRKVEWKQIALRSALWLRHNVLKSDG